MKKLLFVLIAVVLMAIPMSMGASAQEGNYHIPEFAAPDRMSLEIPDEIWNQVLGNIGFEGQTYGYSADIMEHFKGTDCILRIVEMLFRDVRNIPRFTGMESDVMLANEGNFASSTFEAWKLLDAYGARQMSYELPTTVWSVDWIEEDADLNAAFGSLLDKFGENGIVVPITDENMAEWNKLPDTIKRLVVRVLIGGIEARPWIVEAFDQNFLKQYFDTDNLGSVTTDQWYEFASCPWQDDVTGPCPRESFELLDKFDRAYFSTGSNEFMRTTWAAIEEYKLAIAETPLDLADFNYCEIDTPLGTVGIYGDGPDAIEGDVSRHAFIFNLGGDDNYTGITAVPTQFDRPFGVVIDLGGNDVYDSGDNRAALACGLFGIGAIFDLGGDDRYICDESGIGCGWYGTGLVVDYGGNDYYKSRIFGQGAATAGVGMLIDLAGDDYYEALHQSAGFGSTYGAGFLIDLSGNDVYFADPEGDPDEVFEFRTVNLCQGMGFGRRADFGDGHSLGGGFGFLIEGAGDDKYTGSVYTQGAGYWWAVGALEDRGGNDQYFNEQYSCGSAPHFAIGSCVDLAGDDNYNIGNEAGCERQIQGHARDGSIAIFIDGSGNDNYMLPNMAAGSSDLNCLTLFWDRMGDDNYTAERVPPWADAASFGDSTVYDIFHGFRDAMPSVGVFLDTGGVDTYGVILPEDDDEAVANLVPIEFADNHEWRHRIEPPNFGYGLDVSWYGGLAQLEEAAVTE
ncbi:MAG: hypothetical protein NTY09_11875 [bacterium]|nr:hypothetical protein [bacterium]